MDADEWWCGRLVMERVFMLLVAVVSSLMVFIIYDRLTFDDRIPVASWGSTQAINSPVKAGESLLVEVTRDKTRNDCPVTSVRQIIDADGRAYDIPDAVSPGGPVSSDTVRFAYDIPRRIAPGDYILRVFLTYNCDGFVWPTQQPDTRFRVVE